MRLEKVAFKNIKNFVGLSEFSFASSQKINTISGKNGSGKSTIFKSILICQKAFFAVQLEQRDLFVDSINLELARYFTDDSSYIELFFSITNEDRSEIKPSFKIKCKKFNLSKVDWEINCSDSDSIAIKKSWNIENPSDVIIYIDSNKTFSEEDISYDNISINDQIGNFSLLQKNIFYPEKIFSNIYSSLIKDYIWERLVPAKPRRELYFILTKILLKELMPQIEISNFTGSQFEKQFVLLGKSRSGHKVTSYDVRNFSSGEKVLFNILLFINYVQEIGMLIIDEPENHFHEDLLVKFVKLITDITNIDSYSDYIKKLSKKSGIRVPKEIDKVYRSYRLSQVFLLTHSKNLIYNNLYNEGNYYVEGNSFKKIEYDECEKILRELGISSVYSKVLFVEGTTETAYFDLFFNDFNIKIHPLGGCHQVIETYKKLINIIRYIHDSDFCFLIDRDTRSDKEVEQLRNQNPKYFDDHFIVLDRHEFENYLLDEKLFADIIEAHIEVMPEIIKISTSEIEKQIFKIASETKKIVFNKHLNYLTGNTITELNSIFRKKDLPDQIDDYKLFLESKFTNDNIMEKFQLNLENNFNFCKNIYNEDNWNANWKALSDGKIALNKTISHFSSYLNITPQRLKQEMKNKILKGKNYDLNSIADSIIKKFKIKYK